MLLNIVAKLQYTYRNIRIVVFMAQCLPFYSLQRIYRYISAQV